MEFVAGGFYLLAIGSIYHVTETHMISVGHILWWSQLPFTPRKRLIKQSSRERGEGERGKGTEKK